MMKDFNALPVCRSDMQLLRELQIVLGEDSVYHNKEKLGMLCLL